MKCIWILNGKTQLVISPENEREASLLAELAQAPVQIQSHTTLQIGLESASNSVIICKAVLAKEEITDAS